MDTLLAKFRRGRTLPLLLGLLFFGNGFLHLYYHAHLHEVSVAPAHSLRPAADAAALSAEPCPTAEVSAEDFFCPFCSSAIDWWCAQASDDSRFEAAAPGEPRRDLTPPEFRLAFRLRARAPPLA